MAMHDGLISDERRIEMAICRRDISLSALRRRVSFSIECPATAHAALLRAMRLLFALLITIFLFKRALGFTQADSSTMLQGPPMPRR